MIALIMAVHKMIGIYAIIVAELAPVNKSRQATNDDPLAKVEMNVQIRGRALNFPNVRGSMMVNAMTAAPIISDIKLR